jgi:hypothetical protein
MSEPLQVTGKRGPVTAVRDSTLEVGASASSVWDVGGVDWAAPSKATVATASMRVPVGRPASGCTEKRMKPSAPGDNRPTAGSVGGWLVFGSMARSERVRVRVPLFRAAS